MCSQLPGQHVLAPRHISIRDLCLLGRYEHLWPSLRYGGIAVVIGDIEGWCCRTGLNCRPLPYQGSALPLSYGSARRLERGRARVCHRGRAGSTALPPAEMARLRRLAAALDGTLPFRRKSLEEWHGLAPDFC